MERFRGVILDVDGTLVDSNYAHARAYKLALRENGIEIPYLRVRALIGMGGDQLLPTLIGADEDSDLGRAVNDAKKRIFMEKFELGLRPFPRATELLERLHDDGYFLAAASSASRNELERFVRLADPHKVVRDIVSSSDAKPSKPAPPLIEAALDRLGLRPAEAVMLGDTPYDVAAAKAAGVEIIGFRCGGWSDDDLGGALEVWEDPADLLDHYERSILGGGHHHQTAGRIAA